MSYIRYTARRLWEKRASHAILGLSLLLFVSLDASAAIEQDGGGPLSIAAEHRQGADDRQPEFDPSASVSGKGTTTDGNGNSPPVPLASCSTVQESGKSRGFLKAADSDNRANELLFSLDPNNPNFAGPIATAKGGEVWLTDTTTGAFVYIPNPSTPRGRDSFRYRVDDPESFAVSTEVVSATRRIMPLGDSITQGVFNGQESPEKRVGYRRKLLNDLRANGFQVNFVGQPAQGPERKPEHQ